MTTRFTGNFTQQAPLPQAALDAAMTVLGHGRLHRYNLLPGEVGEVSALEEEFAAFTGARYCLAVASGGYALGAALRAVEVQPGDRVLTNAFTLAPVPGAIAAIGAVPVYVEVTEDLVIDLDHLAAMLDAEAGQEQGARVLLLSHMRGHICDMDRLMRLCDDAMVTVIEDCAHTMGAAWRGVASGRHGAIGCYSTQTYKHINSGEGGLLVSDDPDLMARAVIGSGSYMLYDRHRAAPPPEVYEQIRYEVPNVSGRMDALRAAILRPQLAALPQACADWIARHAVIAEALRDDGLAHVPRRNPHAREIGSSIQFLPHAGAPEQIRELLRACAARGVELKWFGAEVPQGYTSRYDSWRYAPVPDLPRTDAVLARLCDMRIPLSFNLDECALIAAIVNEELSRL
ncbi:MAG: aminotransferase class I/II-fold pyridoxal phosphate-dependent enzyme [Celeribacter sp.]